MADHNPQHANLPPLDGVYFLHPSNRLWLKTGKGGITTQRAQHNQIMMLITGGAISLFGLVLSIAALASIVEGLFSLSEIWVCAIPLVGIVLLLAAAHGRIDHRIPRLERNGVLIIGEVIEATPILPFWGKNRAYLRFQYRVPAPKGDVIAERELPVSYTEWLTAGKKIAILYINPRLHEIL